MSEKKEIAPAQQEPIGEVVPRFEGYSIVTLFNSDLPVGTKLYASPQPAQPSVPVESLKDLACRWDYETKGVSSPRTVGLKAAVVELDKLIAAHDGKGK